MQIAKTARRHIELPGLPRGMVFADTAPTMAEVSAAVKALGTAFEEFKQKNDAALAEAKQGRDDVVAKEQVDRINTDVGKLQSQLDDMNAKLTAFKAAGGSASDEMSAEVKAHKEAFRNAIRRGADIGAVNELAIKASLSADSNPDGGYVVTEEVERTITRVLGVTNAMRGIATVQSISGASLKKPKGLGGANAGWVGEKTSRTQTNTPRLAMLEIPAHEMYAMPAATQSLLDDAYINIEEWLGSEAAIEFGELEGSSFIDGDGQDKPLGILGYSMAASSASSPSAWGKIGFTSTGVNGDFVANPNGGDKLIDLVHSLKAGYRQNARWLMNDASQAKTRKLKDNDSNYLWQPGLQAGQPAQLLGYAVTTDDGMPDFATGAFPIAFGDFARGYLIVDRMGTRTLRDPYSSKPYVLFYMTRRVGGGVQDFHAIKVLKTAA